MAKEMTWKEAIEEVLKRAGGSMGVDAGSGSTRGQGRRGVKVDAGSSSKW